MTLLSGIASLLNPFAWLHRSRRTERIERVYELQEDMVLEENEQSLPSSFPSENGEENQFTEGGASDCNVKNEPGRYQIQLNIDEPNTATEALGGSNTEPTEQIDQNMETSQSDSAEKKCHAESERLNHGESELELCVYSSLNYSTCIPESTVAVQAQEMKFDFPLHGEEDGKVRVAMGCVKDETVPFEDNTSQKNIICETISTRSRAPSKTDICTSTGPESTRDRTASSSGTSESSMMEDSVFVVRAPNIEIFGNPTITEIKSARKRRARNVSPGISEVMDGYGTQQPWRAKHPRRSYDLPAAGNPVVTDAQEYSHFAGTPTNTPTSLRTRSKSDKSNTI
uniref:Pecanex-like protein n=1 Tax=Haemonchus contortus TaxID=6289 RepID=A0A7I5ECN1_HAECO